MSIRITAKRENGIRRMGVHHPPVSTVYPDEYFDDDELSVLKNDPDLIVECDVSDAALAQAEERERHLHLYGRNDGRSRAASVSEAARSDESPLGGGDARPSTPLGQSAEQSAAEGDGIEPVDDPEATLMMILLGVDSPEKAPSIDVVASWTPEERRAVDAYCGAAHLAASDNDVEIPEMPPVLDAALAALESDQPAPRRGRKKGK